MGGRDFLTAGETKGIFLADPIHGACIDGDGRVQMRVTPKNLGRKIPPGIGRELGCRELSNTRLSRELVGRGQSDQRAKGEQREATGHRERTDSHDFFPFAAAFFARGLL
jgi:hypothetical protein